MKNSYCPALLFLAIWGSAVSACRRTPPPLPPPPATLNVTHRETIVVLPPSLGTRRVPDLNDLRRKGGRAMSLKAHGQFLLVVLATLLTGCGPDYTPIADGMKALGICFVVYGVIAALADLIKGENGDAEPRPAKRPRKRAGKGREDER
jgi:hypothetical protein